MRGQSGIGTIIVFIAMILAAVVVAIVILQITDSLRGQAMLTNRQAQQTMSARYDIIGVSAVAYKDANTGDYKVYYLILRVRPGLGARSLDLKKTYLTYNGPQVTIPGVKYEPITEVLKNNATYIAAAADLGNTDVNDILSKITGACSASMYNIMTALGTYNYITVVPYIAPARKSDVAYAPGTVTAATVVANRDPAHFTAIWEECAGKDDLGSVSDGQTVYIIYPLPKPVGSSTYITISLETADGWSAPMTLRIPAGLDQGYVTIYPAT